MKKKSFRGNRSTKSFAGLKSGSLQVSADISHEHAQVFLVIVARSEIFNGAEKPAFASQAAGHRRIRSSSGKGRRRADASGPGMPCPKPPCAPRPGGSPAHAETASHSKQTARGGSCRG